jgi:long-chain acyl-CoA synthetase
MQVFDWAFHVGKERRLALNSGASQLDFLLNIKWNIANKLVFTKVKEKFGGNLKYCFTGGAALNKVVQEYFDDMGIPVLEGYGLTETSPMVLAERYGHTEFLQGGLQAVKDVKIYVLDPSSNDVLPDGKEGELACSGPNVMIGYLNAPDKTDECVFVNGNERIFRTGDLAKRNAGKSQILSP